MKRVLVASMFDSTVVATFYASDWTANGAVRAVKLADDSTSSSSVLLVVTEVLVVVVVLQFVVALARRRARPRRG